MMVISGTYLKGQKASELVWPQIALLAFTTPQQFLEYVWPNIVASKNKLAERMLFFYQRRSEDLAENSDSLDEFAAKSHWFKKMQILLLCFFFFQLRTDYLQSQFYTGMRKAADATLNQEAGLLWSVGKQRMSSLLKHQHTSTKKNKSSFKMARKCQKILFFRHILTRKGQSIRTKQRRLRSYTCFTLVSEKV